MMSNYPMANEANRIMPTDPPTRENAAYYQTFEQLKGEIISRKKELGECIQRQEELETRIAHLQEIAIATARMLGTQYVPEDALGLTDAIRQAFKTAPAQQMSPTDVRARLKQMGFDITNYGNLMASIHTVLTRLAFAGEISVSNSTDGKIYTFVKK